jgi:hypothetical protein
MGRFNRQIVAKSSEARRHPSAHGPSLSTQKCDEVRWFSDFLEVSFGSAAQRATSAGDTRRTSPIPSVREWLDRR